MSEAPVRRKKSTRPALLAAVDLVRGGHSYAAAARTLNVKSASVRAACQRFGVTTPFGTVACVTPMKPPPRGPDLTHANLLAGLFYSPTTGEFFHLQGKRAGQRADRGDPNSYYFVCAFGQKVLAHRLAWMYVHGALPANQIDHIDGDKTNNRLSNLRACTQSQNLANRPPQRNSTSGLKGAYFDKRGGRWHSVIGVNGKLKRLGVFDTAEAAHAAYVAAAVEIYGEFARVT